ncbi:hypothetical protein PMV44_16690 [Enterococcus casseliflavus]|uniref:hypothetical protein n=1 Tax=Enterococcus casseliflavus TaxID=37734 RepID=UPI00232EAFFD|nr:hypothetical protein [Enterococcus casseliflavus]MDB1693487.1 hypothetical protein [Enterococcus casseliflavus]
MPIQPVSGEIKAQPLNNNFSYLDSKTNNISKGSPSGTFATVSALKLAYPNGNTNIYVVSSDGKWYFWDGSDWSAGGQYQETGIAENQVSATEIQKNVVNLRVAEADGIPDYDVESKTIDFKSVEGAQQVIIFGNTQIKVPVGTKVTMDSAITSTSLQLIYDVGTDVFSIVSWSKVLLPTELCVGTFKRDGSRVNFPFTITVNGIIPSPAKTKNELAIDSRISALALEDIMVVDNKNLDLFLYEQGIYLNSGGTADSAARIRTKNSVQVVKNSHIEILGDFDMAYVYYDLDGNHIATGTWTKSFIVPETRLLKLMVRKSNNAAITPSDFPVSNVLFKYNGFQNIADNSIPISKIDQRSNRFIHMSFDDVKYTLLDLINNKTIYSSIFDNPFLSALRDFNTKYGMVFSLYVFLEEWLEMDDTYQNDFAENSSWLKFGFHLNEDRENYQFATYEEAQDDYKKFTEKAYEITKNHYCIDRIPRLQNFSFSEVSLTGMRDLPGGVMGMLTADDNRNVTHLGLANESYLRNHDRMYDEELNVMYLSTDLRLENSDDVYLSLSNILLGEMSESLIVFSHEYIFYDSNFALKTIDKIEMVGTFAKELGLKFEFPQNVFKISEPVFKNKKEKTYLALEFISGGINEIGIAENGSSGYRTDYIYLKKNTRLDITVPSEFNVRVIKNSSRNNRDVISQDFSEGKTTISADGKTYFRFFIWKDSGDIILEDTDKVIFFVT